MKALILLLTVLLNCFVWAQSHPPLTEDEKTALIDFKNQGLRFGNGSLLNPPRGVVDPQAQFTVQFIKQIIETLAGDELKKGKYNIVVHLYANNEPNAWIRNLSEKIHTNSGFRWLNSKTPTQWPMRKLFGYDSNDRPIYEIGITTGLLNLLSTVGELAFVLGHELTHLLEGHVDEDLFLTPNTQKRWWNSQSNESVADNKGIERMIGKYDLDSAITALAKLFPKSERDQNYNWAYAVQNAFASHHNEGVRIAMAQFFIEYLRRFNPLASPRTPTKLPQELKIYRHDRSRPTYASDEQKTLFFGVFHKYFLTDWPYDYLNNSDENIFDHKHYQDSLEEALFNQLSESIVHNSAAIRQLVFSALHEIEMSNAKASTKNNALLRLFFLFDRYATAGMHEFMKSLSHDEVQQITLFLAKNSVGPDAWSLKTLQPHINKLEFIDVRVLERTFLQTNNGQKILNSLIKTQYSWKEYWTHITDVNLLRNDQGLLLPHLLMYKKEFIGVVEKGGVLTQKYLHDTYLSLSKIPPKDFFSYFDNKGKFPKGRPIQETPPTLEILADFCEKNELADPGFRSYRKKLIEENLPVFLDGAIQTMDNPTATLFERFIAFNNLSRFIKTSKVVLSEEIYQSLLPSFLKMLNEMTQNLDAFSARNLPSYDDFYIKILNDPRVSKKEKFLVFKLLSTHSPFESDSYFYNKSDFDQKPVQKYLDKLTKTELLNLVRMQFDPILQFMTNIEKHLVPHDFPKETVNTGVYKKIMEDPYFSNMNPSNILKAYHVALPKTLSAILHTGGEQLLERFNFQDIRQLIIDIHRDNENYHFIHGSGNKHAAYKAKSRDQILSNEATDALALFLIRHKKEARDFNEWFDTYTRLENLNPRSTLPEKTLSLIRAYMEEFISDLPPQKKYQWLRHKSVLSALSTEFLAKQLRIYLNSTTLNRNDKKSLIENFQRITKELSLKDSRGDAFQLFRAQIVTDYNLQPNDVNNIFPEDPRTLTEKASGFSTHIRGLSALAAFTRSQSIEEQIEMIEYIMSRKPSVPSFVSDGIKKAKTYRFDISIMNNILPNIRSELYFRSPLERALVVNSILAGPNGAGQSPKDLEVLMNHLLSSVGPQKRDIAKQLAEALFKSEGDNKSFFISYALAQKQKDKNEKLTEVLVIKSLLDAFGVPGIKLGQYLAFSSEFKDYQKQLEDYQDAAMPLDDYEVLKLIQKRMGNEWNYKRHRVVKTLGFGSVNVAIKYEDLQTKTFHVLSLSRDEIETKTKEDFRRFQNFITQLTQSKDNKKYEFLVGLMSIIKRSVELEFDKPHAMKMQKMATTLYNRQVNGWNVKTVDAYEEKNMGLFMEEAQGITAKKMLKQNEAIYKEAMRALLEVEYDILRGVSGTMNVQPTPLFANPDLHDGQVLIDEKTKSVTILDFGQAIEITNQQRDFAIDLLRVISNIQSTESAAKLIEKHAEALGTKNLKLDRAKLREILSRTERMDKFVHLTSLLERSGFKVPLSSVHWVLGANRLIVLGKKTGLSVETMFRNLLLMKKAGFETGTYNQARKTWQGTKSALSKCAVYLQ